MKNLDLKLFTFFKHHALHAENLPLIEDHHKDASIIRIEPQLIGRIVGGLNPKLHALIDAYGRPIRLHFTTGQ